MLNKRFPIYLCFLQIFSKAKKVWQVSGSGMEAHTGRWRGAGGEKIDLYVQCVHIKPFLNNSSVQCYELFAIFSIPVMSIIVSRPI